MSPLPDPLLKGQKSDAILCDLFEKDKRIARNSGVSKEFFVGSSYIILDESCVLPIARYVSSFGIKRARIADQINQELRYNTVQSAADFSVQPQRRQLETLLRNSPEKATSDDYGALAMIYFNQGIFTKFRECLDQGFQRTESPDLLVHRAIGELTLWQREGAKDARQGMKILRDYYAKTQKPMEYISTLLDLDYMEQIDLAQPLRVEVVLDLNKCVASSGPLKAECPVEDILAQKLDFAHLLVRRFVSRLQMGKATTKEKKYLRTVLGGEFFDALLKRVMPRNARSA